MKRKWKFMFEWIIPFRRFGGKGLLLIDLIKVSYKDMWIKKFVAIAFLGFGFQIGIKYDGDEE